jgi:hypothetical protein
MIILKAVPQCAALVVARRRTGGSHVNPCAHDDLVAVISKPMIAVEIEDDTGVVGGVEP